VGQDRSQRVLLKKPSKLLGQSCTLHSTWVHRVIELVFGTYTLGRIYTEAYFHRGRPSVGSAGSMYGTTCAEGEGGLHVARNPPVTESAGNAD
jgi:hypothetical protein